MKNEHKFISKLVKDIEDKFSVLAYAYIDIDNNDNIKHIRYSYSTYKYSRTTKKHIKYVVIYKENV